MKKFTPILAAFYLLSLNSASSQTITETLAGTYNNNSSLQERRNNVLAVHEKSVQASAGWRPTIDLEGNIAGSQSMNSGNAKEQSATPGASGSSANTRDGQIILRQNLFNGWATMANMQGADQTIRSAWAQLQSAEQEVLLQAIKTYLDLLSKFAEVELLKASKESFQKNFEAATEKMRIGEETRTQVANAEAKLAESDAKLQTALADLEGLKATFTDITGLQPAAILQKPEVPQDLPVELKRAVELAREQNPQIIAAQFDHLASQSAAEAKGGELLPRVDLSAASKRSESLSHKNSVYYDQDFRARDFSTDNRVTLSVRVPLYEGGTIRSQKRELHQQAVAKRVAVETARNQVTDRAIQAWQQYQAAKNNIANFQKQVEASKISLEGTQQEMAVGSKILLDVLNAQTALLEAQLKLVEAEKNHFLQAFTLLAHMGMLNARYLKLPVDYFDPQSHYQKTSGRF